MTRPFRLLDATTSSAADASSFSSAPLPLDSDLIVILAALLCALICVLGLVAVARCAWIRRLSASSSPSVSSLPPTHPAYSSKAANKGVKKKTLRSLPRLTFSSSEGKFSDCSICLSSFADGDELRVLPQCGHAFHVPCIDTWLGSHSSCPSCRRILVTSSLPDPGSKTDDESRCEWCGNIQACSSSNVSSNFCDGGAKEDEGGAKRVEEGETESGSNGNDSFLP
ncbi:hypothetical protein MLD38_034335 [Melastoma candidum]|uniref:Uncharacterized protein n=1 Tax=Melastoma candidum TaxID=119954 RepID=A0ACB9M9L2_9MYRT|nr:hypothetical protein MLD38_034335 [Melastoma candidum]